MRPGFTPALVLAWTADLDAFHAERVAEAPALGEEPHSLIFQAVRESLIDSAKRNNNGSDMWQRAMRIVIGHVEDHDDFPVADIRAFMDLIDYATGEESW